MKKSMVNAIDELVVMIREEFDLNPAAAEAALCNALCGDRVYAALMDDIEEQLEDVDADNDR